MDYAALRVFENNIKPTELKEYMSCSTLSLDCNPS